jgi:hypothetical protein
VRKYRHWLRPQAIVCVSPLAMLTMSRRAARWARRLIEAGAERIGVIAPDLAAYQPLLERISARRSIHAVAAELRNDECSFNLPLVPLWRSKDQRRCPGDSLRRSST